MKKIYLLILVCAVAASLNAQKRNAFTTTQYFGKRIKKSVQNGVQSGGGGCDSLNYPVPATWGAAVYLADSAVGGFLTGTNGYNDVAKAQYFDASAYSDNYISQAWIGFGVASSTDPTKQVAVQVYDGTSGQPGTLLGTDTLTMGAIMQAVSDTDYTAVTFNPPIALPSSKQFFVAVDLSLLSWNHLVHDSLAIISSLVDQGAGAWELVSPTYGGGWYSFPDDYNADVALYIHPFLSVGPTCSSSLPVRLTSFTAQPKDYDVLLNWQVTQEVNMKEYDVERAGSNLQFSVIGSVPATNADVAHSYAYTDVNAATGTGVLYYRLKQVDKNGNITYSNIAKVALTGGQTIIKVVNPFSNLVQVHISSPAAQTVQAIIYDLQGRAVTALTPQAISQGDNFITIPTGLLAKGVYMLNLKAGNTVYKYKLLNE